jgi:hypothetical protein
MAIVGREMEVCRASVCFLSMSENRISRETILKP